MNPNFPLNSCIEDACLPPKENENDALSFVSCDIPSVGWTDEAIFKRVEVRKDPIKGRVLHTKVDLNPGEVVFVEGATFFSTPKLDEGLWVLLNKINEISDQPLELTPVWHFAAISSLCRLSQRGIDICLNKWHPGKLSPSADVIKIHQHLPPVYKEKVTLYKYEEMLNIWRYNSFGHHTDNNALVLYNHTSMMAHSCAASCCWHYSIGDAYTLRARRKLYAGDELTISYIGDDDLLKSTDIRREKLRSWLFVCNCERCCEKIQPDSARSFRCQVCSIGGIFISHYYSPNLTFCNNAQEVSATPCNVCGVSISTAKLQELVDIEVQYADRISQCTSEDPADCEKVLVGAQQMFWHHWCLFSLYSLLADAYKEQKKWIEAVWYHRLRLEYIELQMPQPTYTLAWCHEELADMLIQTYSNESNNLELSPRQQVILTRLYEDAYSVLFILCGEEHDYTVNACQKMNYYQCSDNNN